MTTIDMLPTVASETIIIPDPNLQVTGDKVVRCSETTISLQCCVQEGFEVQWSSDICKSEGCRYTFTFLGERNGVIKI